MSTAVTATEQASFRLSSDGGFELPPEELIFGSSAAMLETRKTLERVAVVDVPVLLQGESGTGKEVVARYIHERSSASNGGFVKVNCPAIPGTLFESELFGYQRGAFTGAYASKPGRVETAHRGTLFLDEIAELELGMQAKLLQLLQDGQFSRIGAQDARQVDVRVICATNRNLEREIREGSFRQDLFFRINVVTIELSPLKERREDIPMLVDYFLERHARRFRRPVPRPPKRILAAFESYRWPGNIRELENLIKRFVILGSEEAVLRAAVNNDEEAQDERGSEISGTVVPLKELTRQAVRRLEKRIILNMLEANHWNRRVVSHALGISYAALLYKMRDAGVPARAARRKTASEGQKPVPDAGKASRRSDRHRGFQDDHGK